MADNVVPIQRPVEAALLTRDKLVNLILGMNTLGDPMGANRHHFSGRISQAEADALYLEDWLGAKVINAIPDDMVRGGRELKGLSPDQLLEYTGPEGVEAEFEIWAKIKQALKWARLYGGAGIVIGLDGTGEMHEPLDVDRIRPGSLKWLTVLDRWHLLPEGINPRNPMRAGWGKPQHYRVFDGPDLIHRSRILFFYGVELPYQLAVRELFWGGSVLTYGLSSINNATTAQHGIASLITEASVDVYSLPNLFDQLSSDVGTQNVTTRIRLAQQGKSINNAIILDKNEDWEQKTDALSQGLAGLLSQFLEVVAGAYDIPVTRLLGTSPTGLNATGEENTRNYYDRISADQKEKLDPVMAPLDAILLRHQFGKVPSKFESTWASLWQQQETERSTVEKQDAERDIALIDNGVIEPHHSAERIRLLGLYPTLSAEHVAALKMFAMLEPSPSPFGPGPEKGEGEETEEPDADDPEKA